MHWSKFHDVKFIVVLFMDRIFICDIKVAYRLSNIAQVTSYRSSDTQAMCND